MSKFENVPAECDHEEKVFHRGKIGGVILMIVCKLCGGILYMRPGVEEKRERSK